MKIESTRNDLIRFNKKSVRSAQISKTVLAGIDCLALPEKFSGAAYYINHLTKNLLEAERLFNFIIFCKPQHRALFAPWLRPGDKIISVRLRNRAEQLIFYEFKLKALLHEENVKIFYATHYISPPISRDYFLISTFHDMGFLLFPQYYPLVKRLYFGKRMKTFLKRANRIVAISHSTASSIVKLFPEFAPKISIIYPGADHLADISTPIPPEPIIEPPFILAVNTFEKRKNIPFIIRVFNHLKQNYHLKHKLLLVGQPANGNRDVFAEINRSPYRSQIRVVNSLSAEKLGYCYRLCDFFINVSEYEGFGFTPFEALSHDRPVFLHKNNIIAELLGDHPYIFNHLNVETWSHFIREELDNSFHRKISREAIRHLKWQHTAKSTLQLMEQLILTGEESVVS